jgi:hypothetical protein
MRLWASMISGSAMGIPLFSRFANTPSSLEWDDIARQDPEGANFLPIKPV